MVGKEIECYLGRDEIPPSGDVLKLVISDEYFSRSNQDEALELIQNSFLDMLDYKKIIIDDFSGEIPLQAIGKDRIAKAIGYLPKAEIIIYNVMTCYCDGDDVMSFKDDYNITSYMKEEGYSPRSLSKSARK